MTSRYADFMAQKAWVHSLWQHSQAQAEWSQRFLYCSTCPQRTTQTTREYISSLRDDTNFHSFFYVTHLFVVTPPTTNLNRPSPHHTFNYLHPHPHSYADIRITIHRFGWGARQIISYDTHEPIPQHCTQPTISSNKSTTTVQPS